MIFKKGMLVQIKNEVWTKLKGPPELISAPYRTGIINDIHLGKWNRVYIELDNDLELSGAQVVRNFKFEEIEELE